MSALPLSLRRRWRLRPFLLVVCLLVGPAVAWASGGAEAAKKEDAEPPPKEPTYIKEKGVEARGYTYKRVARDDKGEPEPVPKAPLAEPAAKENKSGEKKAEGHGGGHDAAPEKGDKKKDEKKKEDKKDDKKEAKAEGHGGGGGEHGGKEAKVEKKIQLSKVYARSVVRLGLDDRPLTPVVHSNRYADYFLCRDTISDRFRATLLDEMNTFSDQLGLTRAQDLPCMIKIAKPGTKVPGAVFVEFYVDEGAARTCIRGGECGETRLVLLMPRDKSGKSPQDIYRSYTLTDATKLKRGDYCVSPRGQLLAKKSCYIHLHPDWLFN